MRHGLILLCAVLVLHIRWEPDDVAGTDLFDRAALPLDEPTAARDDESLSQRMRVPCGTRPGLERHAQRVRTTLIFRLEQAIKSDITGEVLFGPLPSMVSNSRL